MSESSSSSSSLRNTLKSMEEDVRLLKAEFKSCSQKTSSWNAEVDWKTAMKNIEDDVRLLDDHFEQSSLESIKDDLRSLNAKKGKKQLTPSERNQVRALNARIAKLESSSTNNNTATNRRRTTKQQPKRVRGGGGEAGSGKKKNHDDDPLALLKKDFNGYAMKELWDALMKAQRLTLLSLFLFYWDAPHYLPFLILFIHAVGYMRWCRLYKAEDYDDEKFIRYRRKMAGRDTEETLLKRLRKMAWF